MRHENKEAVDYPISILLTHVYTLTWLVDTESMGRLLPLTSIEPTEMTNFLHCAQGGQLCTSLGLSQGMRS